MHGQAMASTTNLFWVRPHLQFDKHYLSSHLHNHSSFCVTARPAPPLSKSGPCPSLSASVALRHSSNAVATDCNEKIRQFCELGSLRDAVQTLSESPKSELELGAYCSVLQLCAEHRALKEGRKVHSVISSNGLKVEDVLGAKLVFMYVSCGDLSEGRRVFDQIGNDKVFLWNFLINEYAKVGDFQEGSRLYYRMKEFGVEANSYTFSCAFKCFTGLGHLKEGENAHGSLLKVGFGDYTVVVNSLIAFYFKCGVIDSARKVFAELTERDVISWNSMISGYASNGFPWKGLQHFKQMLHAGFMADQATMVCILAASADVGSLRFAKTLHSYVIKGRFDRDMMIQNTLIDTYSKCGDLDGAVQVFKNMDKKSVVSWTAMVAGYARQGLSDEAITLFHEMEQSGIRPDTFAISNALHACSCTASLTNGRNLHGYIRKTNLLPNLLTCNALMDMYAKCGSMEEVKLVFHDMPVKDVISWNTMIGGYSKNSLPNEALNLFSKMQQEIEPDGVTLACVLPAIASLSSLERGREVHGYVLRKGFLSDPYIGNALIDMYAKCGAIALARLVFIALPSKDLISWTVMIAGYGIHGLGREAVETFNEMRDACVEPDEHSFISILRACSHSGLVDEGWRFYNIMKFDYKIEPNMEHLACMVDLLVRAGKLTKAYKFIEQMEAMPDTKMWMTLLNGCRMHQDLELAEKVAERILEVEPENPRHYVLLASVYAEAEKWTEAKQLRDRISRHESNKDMGSSWIELKGKVHIFNAGKIRHPQSRNIESLLRRSKAVMVEEGFSQKRKYSLTDPDEMEREIALCGHSEQFAMGFGVLSLPPGQAIRVTKNQRVCVECHEMAKFMSRSHGRDILLRDSNRFHHFRDGLCSCKGYW